jgi:hypothetical protein
MVEFLAILQQGKTFDDFPHLAQSANGLLDDVAWWAKVLQSARRQSRSRSMRGLKDKVAIVVSAAPAT